VYGQPIYQPIMLPQIQQPQPPQQREPRQSPLSGTQLMRGVLILAAVAGLVTVIIGAVTMVSSPEEYAPSDRPIMRLAQGGLAPTVGPGGPGQALTQAVPAAPPPVPSAPPAPAMLPSSPERLVIPKLKIDAPVTSVGTDKTGAIQTPPISNPNLVGWYRGGPTPGEAGPAVMLGHKDTVTRSAVFSRLHELRNGDQIQVVRMDGTVAVFTVGGVEQANKQTFPTNRVYGPQDNAELRLITCGGTYNHTTGHYVDNVIVYATMTGTHLVKTKKS
jgi:LPXTG-site transpeptidase (sortase) family protein